MLPFRQQLRLTPPALHGEAAAPTAKNDLVKQLLAVGLAAGAVWLAYTWLRPKPAKAKRNRRYRRNAESREEALQRRLARAAEARERMSVPRPALPHGGAVAPMSRRAATQARMTEATTFSRLPSIGAPAARGARTMTVSAGVPVRSQLTISGDPSEPRFGERRTASQIEQMGHAEGFDYGMAVAESQVRSGAPLHAYFTVVVDRATSPYRWGFKKGVEDALWVRGLRKARRGLPLVEPGRLSEGTYLYDEDELYEGGVAPAMLPEYSANRRRSSRRKKAPSRGTNLKKRKRR